jgi:hypothetical protein
MHGMVSFDLMNNEMDGKSGENGRQVTDDTIRCPNNKSELRETTEKSEDAHALRNSSKL